MKVLFDTNVVLDVLLDRKPLSGPAAELFARVEKKELSGYLGATTVTTIHYLACKAKDRKDAEKDIRRLLMLFEVAPINKPVLQTALDASFNDYEDAVLHEAAITVQAEGIVTRNASDFKKAKLPVLTPFELLAILNKSTTK